MFCVKRSERTGSCAVLIVWSQLETIQIGACKNRLITVKMLVIGHLHLLRIEETANRDPVTELPGKFKVYIINYFQAPLVIIDITAENPFDTLYILKMKSRIL